MKTFSILALTLLMCVQCTSQNILDRAKKEVNKQTGIDLGGSSLSNDEIIRGLKEALNVGSQNASSKASMVDGFFKNPAIKIPFPPEVKVVETKARQIGLGSQVDKFVLTLNRAAEEASKEAAPVFMDAIRTMTIQDGLSILNGGDNAATNYLKGRTTAELTNRFSPIVKRAVNKVELTRYWNPVITAYNKIPGVTKKNPDLDRYITEKTLEGLFRLIAEEETKIRKDPAARVSDILRKVFGKK